MQGQTIRQPTAVVVDLKYAKNEAQVYVMLSRAQNLSQIYIIGQLYEEKWKASSSGLFEFKSGLENAINIQHNREKKPFEIVSMNILSLRKHYVDLLRRFENSCVNVINLQETWLEPNTDASDYSIRDMTPHLNSIGRGKGLATYVEEGFILRGEFIGEEHCQLMKVSNEDIEIINVYRSQECSTQVFQDKLNYVVDPSRPTIVCGDTNIDISRDRGNSFVEFMENLGLAQLVTQPTHSRGGLLDHVWVTADLTDRVKVTQTAVYFSDHEILTITILNM